MTSPIRPRRAATTRSLNRLLNELAEPIRRERKSKVKGLRDETMRRSVCNRTTLSTHAGHAPQLGKSGTGARHDRSEDFEQEDR